MKNFFAFLLYCFALTVVACDDATVGTPDQWFRQPEVTVEGTSVEVRCLTFFGSGVLSSTPCGFVCAPVSGDAQTPPRTVADPEVDGSVMGCTFADLEAESVYYVYPYVELGDSRITGRPAVFETGKPGEEPDPDPVPEPEPAPTGYDWAELPVMTDKEGCYYGVHYCTDLDTPAGAPARNYTVCYSHEMYSALWSAYPLHTCYQGDQGRTNKWAYDPIIPEAVQPWIVEKSYQPQPGYSKGHLIASNDRTLSEPMNRQTFYVTNSTPQWQNGFNGGVWSTLEGRTWNNVCADTLFVVSGVYYANTDKTVTDTVPAELENEDLEPHTIYVPTNYYKVMIRSKAGNTGKPLSQLAADELQCIGFWFDNQAYPNGASPTLNMKSVAEIEQITGMTFFANVPAAPKNSNAGNWSF